MTTIKIYTGSPSSLTEVSTGSNTVTRQVAAGTTYRILLEAPTSGTNRLKIVGPATPPSVGRHAGHEPGRIRFGMSATELNGSNLQWDTALGLVGGQVYERRKFFRPWLGESTGIASNLNNILNYCDAHDMFPILSYKVPSNNWAGLANGTYDAALTVIRNVAAARPKPFCFSFHHEPAKDGTAQAWSAMQLHACNFFASVNNRLVYTPIGNGWWFGTPGGYTDAQIADYFPASLINAINTNRGAIAADLYDAPVTSQTNRTHHKVVRFAAWADRVGVNNLCVGEVGCHTGSELTASWNALKARKDKYSIVNYFNSGQNSSSDWTLRPNGWPPDPVADWADTGGTAESEARLNAFIAAVTESGTM